MLRAAACTAGLGLVVFNLLIGLVGLVGGAELLVRGGGQLALALRVPALVVGLTVVAFGTSMPELLVSVTAALEASTDMALANVNGSNIANIALVLGVASMVHPLTVERTLMRREVPTCIGLQLLVFFACWDSVISMADGVLFVLAGFSYNAWLLWEALRGRAPVLDDDLETDGKRSPMYHVGMLVAGLLVLVVGARLFVGGAEEAAQLLGLSDRFIGLTVVALGTSAPEVATGVVSARRGEVELAVGNSLGSNILNIAMVLGVTAIIMPIPVLEPGVWSDLTAALVATTLLVPVVLKGRLNRLEGFLLSCGYLSYMGAGYFL